MEKFIILDYFKTEPKCIPFHTLVILHSSTTKYISPHSTEDPQVFELRHWTEKETLWMISSSIAAPAL